MGRNQLHFKMKAATVIGLLVCVSIFVTPTLSVKCYNCVGGGGVLKCDDSNPGTEFDCTSLTDWCQIVATDDVEVRSCGAGNIADTPLKESCKEETIGGQKKRTCQCKGKLCNETWKKAGWNGSSGSSAATVYISSLAIIFYIVTLFL